MPGFIDTILQSAMSEGGIFSLFSQISGRFLDCCRGHKCSRLLCTELSFSLYCRFGCTDVKPIFMRYVVVEMEFPSLEFVH